jgi:hypothetical protein
MSPSFFRPFFFFVEVKRVAEAASRDTAVPRNGDGPHILLPAKGPAKEYFL